MSLSTMTATPTESCADRLAKARRSMRVASIIFNIVVGSLLIGSVALATL